MESVMMPLIVILIGALCSSSSSAAYASETETTTNETTTHRASPQPRELKIERSATQQWSTGSRISPDPRGLNVERARSWPTRECGFHYLNPGDVVTIKSKNHPYVYPRNYYCKWKFEATSSNSKIAIQCNDFILAKECKYSFMLIIGGDLNKMYWGQPRLPFSQTSSNNKLEVSFRAGLSRRRGFYCNVMVLGRKLPIRLPQPASHHWPNGSSILPDPRVLNVKQERSNLSCGFHYLNPGDVVTIESKNHPETYPRYHYCNWEFEATSSDSQISIRCSDFILAKECKYSFMLIIGKGLNRMYWGEPTLPFKRTSRNNKLEVSFRTGKSRRSGFNCTVTASASTAETSSQSTVSSTSETSSKSTTTSSPPCDCGRKNSMKRIVEGQDTTPNEYPWHVGIFRWSEIEAPFCGGSIISETYVITAAHCVDRFSITDIGVLIGAHSWADGDKVGVNMIVVHSGFNSNTLDNDIALLELGSPIDITSDMTVSRVCLPADSSNLYEGHLGILTGWGTTSVGGTQPLILQEATVLTMHNDACYEFDDVLITENMICAGYPAGGRDSCQGDSGGPLVIENNESRMVLIGIISWGIGCGQRGRPGVNARVTKYLDWIRANSPGAEICTKY